MPRVNIYIRNADWEDWQMIDDIPGFISNAIARENLEAKIAVRDHIVNEGRELGILDDAETEDAKLGTVKRPIKTAEDAVKAVFPEAKVQKFCPNGHPIPEDRDRCFGKGCKYS